MEEHVPAAKPVAILIGSRSDLEMGQQCARELAHLGVSSEMHIVSAHRTPDELDHLVAHLDAQGVEVYIAAAGLSAALPGAVAARTLRPVIGLPLASGPLSGWDALLSVAQMPPGVPVATVGVGAARNAALLAVRIMARIAHASGDDRLLDRLYEHREAMAHQVRDDEDVLQEQLRQGGGSH